MPQRVGVVVRPSHINEVGPDKYRAVFNPAVHAHINEEKIYILCRLINSQGHSEIRLVILDLDYKIVEISKSSLLYGTGDEEQFGCEDPRITEIEENRHYLTYTAVRGTKFKPVWKTRIGLAVTEDFHNCQRLGLFLPDQDNNKNGVLLNEKIHHAYWLYHRFHPNVWIASSPDLQNWQNIRPIMFVRPGWWDSSHIGIGIILPTDRGHLAFYHGADETRTYRIGVALFHREKPWKLLARSRSPLLEPAKKYERQGLMPNVVFPCGGFQNNGTYVIFYGAADLVTAVAKFTKKEVFNNLRSIR